MIAVTGSLATEVVHLALQAFVSKAKAISKKRDKKLHSSKSGEEIIEMFLKDNFYKIK